DEAALQSGTVVPFHAPGAERDAVGLRPALDHLLPGQPMHRLDVARLARAELGTGRGEVGASAARQAAQNVEIGPGLLPAAPLGGALAQPIARIVVLGSEIADDVARDRQAREHAAILAEGPAPRRLRGLYGGGELVGGHGDVARNAA